MMGTRQFQAGDVLGPLVKPPVTKTQLVMYSGASGDFNPIHTVDEFAEKVGLGGVIAHGMLTMAFVGQLLTDTIGRDAELRQFGVRFVDMVRPGDVVTCEGKVTSVEETGEVVRVTSDVYATVQRTGRQVVAGTAVFTSSNH